MKNQPVDPKKEFMKSVEYLGRRMNSWRVFADFCEMGALALQNPLLGDDSLEARYLEVVRCYEPEEQKLFPRLFNCVVDALEADPEQDFLGTVFQELNLASHWHGQFFTPYHLCKLIAQLSVEGAAKAVEEKGFATLAEPACGAGALVIAFCNSMRAAGMNYQQCLAVDAQDVDSTAVHMAYIQLSLLHVPARVILGNTLALEQRRVWRTPAFLMGGWQYRLAARDMDNVVALPAKPAPTKPVQFELALAE